MKEENKNSIKRKNLKLLRKEYVIFIITEELARATGPEKRIKHQKRSFFYYLNFTVIVKQLLEFFINWLI